MSEEKSLADLIREQLSKFNDGSEIPLSESESEFDVKAWVANLKKFDDAVVNLEECFGTEGAKQYLLSLFPDLARVNDEREFRQSVLDLIRRPKDEQIGWWSTMGLSRKAVQPKCSNCGDIDG